MMQRKKKWCKEEYLTTEKYYKYEENKQII